MGKIVQFPKKIGIALIKGYQYFLSPWCLGCCRFYPSCSQYAVIAMKRFGLLRGLVFTVLRLGRCHPGGKQWGYDPVPDKKQS